jgi:glutathione synthase/RimK-type ligase-like ATP-grasp enzyme
MKVYIVTNSCGGLPQKLHETESLDVDVFGEHLRRHGHAVEIMDHAALIRREPEQIRGAAIFYASAQYPEYYQYIEHCLLYAEICGGHLVPNYLCFRAHENKFVQELLKKKWRLSSPASQLYGTGEEIARDLPGLAFPAILKYPQGFASTGVSRVDSAAALQASLAASMIDTVPAPEGLLRRIVRRRDHAARIARYRGRYPLQSKRFIVQEFLPDLAYDWKILVFGDRLFTLKRFVRQGDFRASGSGNFSFAEVPAAGLLDFAWHVRKTIDSPWASLDVAEADGEYYLIEFQCVHFGLYTLMRNTCYHEQNAGVWQRREVANAAPEPFFGDAAVAYLAEHFPPPPA